MALIARLKPALAAIVLVLCGAGATGSATAQDSYPVEGLAGVMGELHYIHFACQGRESQRWRETMLELLEHEAPTRGGYRDRLIASFNEGFQIQQRQSPRCGAEAEMQQNRLATRGRTLSEQLRRQYLE